MKSSKSCVERSLLKKALSLVALCFLILGPGLSRANAQVPGVIFDSDMSSDHDDAADLALLNALANLGECNILACMSDAGDGGSTITMNAINTYYGHPNVPCGMKAGSSGYGGYNGAIANEFPHPLYAGYEQCPMAVPLYRQILASQPDHSVVIVTTGFMNNIADLLQSGPDQYSSLSGSALVAQKVKLLSCTGGQYPSGGEFNFTVQPTAAQYAINNWPAGTPVVYTGFELGGLIVSAGSIQATSLANPVRRAFELTFWGAYPTWGQQGVYLAVRGTESATLWDRVNVGYNTVASNGVNTWVSTGTPNQYAQAYLVDKVRFPLQEAIRTLVVAPPPSQSAPPSQPSNVRATIASGTSISLQWTDNSYSETGFKIERGVNGVYTQVGTVGANVTTYTDTGLSSTANVSYRVRATNSIGDSPYSSIWVYSGWTETNFDNAGNLPLYSYYQTCDLKGVGGSNNNHVTVNNDSTHGQNLTVNVDVSGSNGGPYYIYFFYQNSTNWYRVGVSGSTSKFEKSVGGSITQIGSAGPGVASGERLEHWQVLVTQSGNLQFLTDWSTGENVSPALATILNVSDTLSFTTGKVGLGGQGGSPTWQNFNFNTLTNVAKPPTSPSGVSATPGSGQVALTWTAVSGATSYNVYQARGANGEGSTPLASGLTGPSYTHTGLTNGTPSYYKVAAVNSTGISSYSYEVSATPGTTITTIIPNGTYEIASLSPGMAMTITGSTATPSVVQQPYSSSSTQQWALTNLGNNVVSLVNLGNSLALEAPGASPVNGAYVGTGTYTGASHQIWQIVATSTAGYYNIINLNSSLGLNVAFGSSSPGIGIVQYAVSGSGNSIWAFTSTGGGGSAPSAPTGLAATGGNAQASLSWTASSGATSYNVYRGTTAGGESATAIVTGLTGTTYVNTGLTNGTAYYYTVKAVNGFGSSGASNETNTTPTAGGSAPAAPAGLGATAGNTQVSLSWTTSSGATSYNVYRGTASGGESTTAIATGITTTTYTNTGLTNGTAYYYKVAAVNSFGTSAYSNEATATPTAGGGGGSGLTGTVIGTAGSYGGGTSTTGDKAFDGNLATYFDAPTASDAWTGLDLGTARVITQLAYAPRAGWGSRMTGGLFQAANAADFTGAVTLFTVTGTPAEGSLTTQTVSNGTAYRYVRYLSPANGWCNVAEVVFYGSAGGGSAPAAPTGLGATAASAQVSLSWTAASGATSYEVYRGTSAGGESATAIVTGLTATTYVNTGLTNGTTYYYIVKAINTSGSSGASNEALATPTAGGSAPSAPTGLGATAGNTQVSLSWTASSGATTYNVYRGTTAGGESTTAIVTGLTGTTYTNTGLTNGTAYYYKVAAVNSFGTSGYSNEASATPTAGGGGGGTSIGIQFFGAGTALATADSAGVPGVAQDHWQALSGSSFSSTALTNNTGGSASATLSGSATGVYIGGGTFSGGNQKLAGGELFNGDITTVTNSFTVSSIPYAIYDVYVYGACDAGGRNATFTITPSGGAASSKSFQTQSAASVWTEGTNTWNGSGTAPTLSPGNYVRFAGLTASSFNLKFGGVGNVGLNGIQIVSVSGGGGSAPAAPTALTATAGSAQVGLSWTASSGATSYNIYRGTTAGGESTTPMVTGLTTTTYTNTGLVNGTAYYYKVRAVNSFGTSTDSNEANATPTAGGSAPAAPTGLGATAGNAQLNLAWTASSGATTYNVYRGTTAGGESTTPVVTGLTGTTYVNTGLTNGTAYYFKVAAVNSFGTSAYSNEASATPTTGGGSQLAGTVIGTSGSYGGSQWTVDKVFDNNLTTIFDSNVGSGAWAGLDLGTAKVITQIKYCPRDTFASRMVGGVFQGANSADFSDAVNLFTVTASPTEGTLNVQSVSNGTAFRYVRYLSAPNGWCNVAEVQFFGN